MARVFKCFVGLDTELGNMVANHARALEGYFPPAVNLKKVRCEAFDLKCHVQGVRPEALHVWGVLP
jgi:hypothetical protein